MTTLDLENIVLGRGAHEKFEEGACLLEAASYMAGEPWSDRPACVSTALAAFGRNLNDRMTDEERQRLVPFIPRLIGTRGDGKDVQRGWMARNWLVREYLPMILAGTGHEGKAAELRALEPVTSSPSSRAARGKVREIRDELWDLRSKALEGIRAQVRAELPKRGLTDAAAAADAAADAAAAAGYSTVWNVAYRAAREKLDPIARERVAPYRAKTIDGLVELFDRMIEAA